MNSTQSKCLAVIVILVPLGMWQKACNKEEHRQDQIREGNKRQEIELAIQLAREREAAAKFEKELDDNLHHNGSYPNTLVQMGFANNVRTSKPTRVAPAQKK